MTQAALSKVFFGRPGSGWLARCSRGGTDRRAFRWTRPIPAGARTVHRPATQPASAAGRPTRAARGG